MSRLFAFLRNLFMLPSWRKQEAARFEGLLRELKLDHNRNEVW